MKKVFLSLLIISVYTNIYAQYNRLPVSTNFELYVPKSISNKAFVTAFAGNLDWNTNISYHFKNKIEFGLAYRRTNFKAGYNNKKYIATLKTKFIINAFGARVFYTFFDNSYFYTQVGFATYYCKAYYNNVTFNNLPIKNPELNFLLFEPNLNVNYKASDYIDIGFQIGTSITNNIFNPTIAHLDEATKFGNFKPEELTNSKTSFISFGFNIKWYLQFENSE